MPATIQSINDTVIAAIVSAGAGIGNLKVVKNSVQATGPVFNYWVPVPLPLLPERVLIDIQMVQEM